MADGQSAGAHDAHPAQETRVSGLAWWFWFPRDGDELPGLILAGILAVALIGAIACWGQLP